jgi:hypothetical protein
MATDVNNILRVDLPEIYDECQGMTEIKARALELDPDVFAISVVVKNQIHSFAMEGASLIADNASIIRNSAQTGMDALTYKEEDDEPDPPVENDYGDIIPPYGEDTDLNQKLVKKTQDLILFEIEDIETESNRYTVVQNFIKSALVHYILFKWYELVAKPELAAIEFVEYEKFTGKARFNSIRNQGRINEVRPYRMY